MSNTIGYTSDDQIGFAMANYNNMKKQRDEVAKPADDVEYYRTCQLDMNYWNVRLIAAGALDLQVAAPPPVPGAYMDEDKYEQRMADAKNLAYNMEQFEGYPLNGCIGE